MVERPPTPPVSHPLDPWLEPEDDDLGEALGDLPGIAALVAMGLVFLAVLIVLVLTLVTLAKFPWLAGG